MTNLLCPHCGRAAGRIERDRLVFRSRQPRNDAWDDDPIDLEPLPVSWHCPRCRREVWLNQRPEGRAFTLDTHEIG